MRRDIYGGLRIKLAIRHRPTCQNLRSLSQGHADFEGDHRCRGNLVLGYFLGAIRFDPTLMVGAIAATIGGVVILGSNSSTSQQTIAAMKAAETERDELIDMINPRSVGTGRQEPARATFH